MAKAQAKKAEQKPSQALTVSGSTVDDELLGLLQEDQGLGVDDMGSDDLAIPRLSILQALSPAVNKRDDAYIEGAEPGKIVESVSKELIDGEKGFSFIPVAYRKTHVAWKPRSEGGGFAGDLGLDYDLQGGCARNEKGDWVNDQGNLVVLTYEYLISVIADDDSVASALMSLSKSQIRKAKQLNTMLKTAQPVVNGQRRTNLPIFFHKVHAVTVPESNDQGNWFGWKFKIDGSVFDLPEGAEIYKACRDLREAFASGVLRTAPPSNEHDIADDEGDSAPM